MAGPARTTISFRRPRRWWAAKNRCWSIFRDSAARRGRRRHGTPRLMPTMRQRSFGGRVGLRLGVHHPDVLRGLVLVSAAGIPLERPWWQRQRGKLRQARFRWLRQRAGGDAAAIEALEKRFGSADYVQSRAL